MQKNSSDSKMPRLNQKSDFYRPSASAIIASRSEELENGYDYRLLLFKRTPQTAFAPDHCVFPGGSLDLADESIEWLRYFKEFGISVQSLESLILTSNDRPEFLHSQGTGCYDRFFKKDKIWARDITLRITALRETFEEVGILLCRKKGNWQHTHSFLGNFYEEFDRPKWQQLVHNDATQFLTLCQTLNVIPDLWCLQEWSTWRSPATAIKKFDTVFYFVVLNRIPNVLPERSEVALPMWHSPQMFLSKFRDCVLWLPLIIFYELSRLCHLRDWEKLFRFICQRSVQGSTLMMPAYFRCKDGFVATLPGDDAYPQYPNAQTDSIIVDSNVAEFRKRSKNVHRVVQRHMHDLLIDTNTLPFNGHLAPIEAKIFLNKL